MRRILARVQGEEAHSRRLMFLKSYLEFGSKLARINFAGFEQDGPKRSNLPAWSRAAEIYFYYFITKLILCCLLQYNYIRTIEEFAQLNVTMDETDKRWPLRQQKQAELAHAIELVEILENPLYELGRSVQIVAIFTLIAAINCYLEVRIYNHLYGPIVMGVARLFLSPKLERKLMIKEAICPQIDQFIESSKNFLNVYSVRLQLDFAKWIETATGPLNKTAILDLQKRMRKLRCHHENNVKMLPAMVANGELDPLNRRPEWARKLALIYSTLVPAFLIFYYIFGLYLLIVLPLSGRLGVRLHYGWRGILFTFEAYVFCLIYYQMVSFPLILMSFNTLDQAAYTDALERMVTELADDILMVNRLTGGLASRRLLRMLIQYKVLKQQLCITKGMIGFMLAHIIVAILFAPALARGYAANLSADGRKLHLFICLLLILTLTILILPTCYLHARCLKLYRSMSYLLARLDAVNHLNQEDRAPNTLHIDEHTLWLLRRELHQAEFATEQFATDAYFMHLTYSNLIGVHFYCGLWLTPMLMRDTSGLESGTSFLLGLL